MTEQVLPPQNLEAEESILGGILLEPSAMDRIADILPAQAFYLPAHRQIYGAFLELYRQNKPTDLMTVISWLADHKLLKKVGGREKLAQLAQSTVSAFNIEHHAQLVLSKYQRRQLIEAGRKIVELGYDTAIEIEKAFEESEAQLFSITEQKTDRFQPESIGECLVSVWQKVERCQSPALSTGLKDLDGLIGGLVKEDLIVIAGRASMGKTWLGCHLANHVAVTYNLPVVFFSAEMGKEQLTRRFLAMHAQIDSYRLTHNQIYKSELETLSKALGTLSRLPIVIDDTPASLQNPSRMRSALRRIKSERGSLGLVVMDYIQKLGDRAARNRAQAVGAFSGTFKDIAKEFGVAFVALAQINRGVEAQANKRPTMADIKDSGDIEQDMDVGLLLYRDEYYNSRTLEQGVMEINVAKNRNGGTGICKVLFEPTVGAIGNLVRSEKVV